MKVIVCGGRDYSDQKAVFDALDRWHTKQKISILIHGAASGADRLAESWANARGIISVAVKPLWKHHGKAAGPLRNRAMLKLKPHMVIAFPGGAGTSDMIKAAKEDELTVWEPYKPKDPDVIEIPAFLRRGTD